MTAVDVVDGSRHQHRNVPNSGRCCGAARVCLWLQAHSPGTAPSRPVYPQKPTLRPPVHWARAWAWTRRLPGAREPPAGGRNGMGPHQGLGSRFGAVGALLAGAAIDWVRPQSVIGLAHRGPHHERNRTPGFVPATGPSLLPPLRRARSCESGSAGADKEKAVPGGFGRKPAPPSYGCVCGFYV